MGVDPDPEIRISTGSPVKRIPKDPSARILSPAEMSYSPKGRATLPKKERFAFSRNIVASRAMSSKSSKSNSPRHTSKKEIDSGASFNCDIKLEKKGLAKNFKSQPEKGSGKPRQRSLQDIDDDDDDDDDDFNYGRRHSAPTEFTDPKQKKDDEIDIDNISLLDDGEDGKKKKKKGKSGASREAGKRDDFNSSCMSNMSNQSLPRSCLKQSKYGSGNRKSQSRSDSLTLDSLNDSQADFDRDNDDDHNNSKSSLGKSANGISWNHSVQTFRASIENSMVQEEVFYVEDLMQDFHDSDNDDGIDDNDDDDSNSCKEGKMKTNDTTGVKDDVENSTLGDASGNEGSSSARILERDVSGKIDYFEDNDLPIGATAKGKSLRRRSTLERAKAFFGSLSNVLDDTGEGTDKMNKCDDEDDKIGKEVKNFPRPKSRRNRGKLSASTTGNKHEAALNSSMKLFNHLASKRGSDPGEGGTPTARGSNESGVESTNFINSHRKGRRRGDCRHLAASATTNKNEAALKSSMTLFNTMAAKRVMGKGEMRDSGATDTTLAMSSLFSESDRSLDEPDAASGEAVLIPRLDVAKSRRGSNGDENERNDDDRSDVKKEENAQGEKCPYLGKISDILYVG